VADQQEGLALVMGTGTKDSSPRPPFILFDDDDWMLVYDSVDELLSSQEWPYVDDEVKAVFDGRARRLWLTGRNRVVEIAHVDLHPSISLLASLAATYFRRRTNGHPPMISYNAEEYVDTLVRAHASTPNTRRKRRV
jgi:hypothetical protein